MVRNWLSDQRRLQVARGRVIPPVLLEIALAYPGVQEILDSPQMVQDIALLRVAP
jgi:hypothetical protein